MARWETTLIMTTDGSTKTMMDAKMHSPEGALMPKKSEMNTNGKNILES